MGSGNREGHEGEPRKSRNVRVVYSSVPVLADWLRQRYQAGHPARGRKPGGGPDPEAREAREAGSSALRRGTIQNKPENAARVRQLRERWRLERPVGGAARRGSDRRLAPEAEHATPGGGAGARRWKDRVRDARTATPVGLEREGCSDALPRGGTPGTFGCGK